MKEIPENQWDLPIVLSSDGEGNGYSPLSDHDIRDYYAENTWSGYVSHPDDEEDEYEDEEPVKAELSLVFWPVN
jgi:hypothetical protein